MPHSDRPNVRQDEPKVLQAGSCSQPRDSRCPLFPDLRIFLFQGLPGAYPIDMVTYEIVCEKGNTSASLGLIKSFLTYAASTDGQTAATKVGYAPLPDSVRTKVASTVGNLS